MIKKLVTIAALAMLLGSPASYADFITGNSLAQDLHLSARSLVSLALAEAFERSC